MKRTPLDDSLYRLVARQAAGLGWTREDLDECARDFGAPAYAEIEVEELGEMHRSLMHLAGFKRWQEEMRLLRTGVRVEGPDDPH